MRIPVAARLNAIYLLIYIVWVFRSVLWCCWLGGRKGIWPVKTEWWGVGMVICLERGADLHMAQLMSLPLTVSCFSKIQIGLTFLVPAHLGSPGKGPLNGCVWLFSWYMRFGSFLVLKFLSGASVSSCLDLLIRNVLSHAYRDTYVWLTDWLNVFIMTSDKPQMKLQCL